MNECSVGGFFFGKKKLVNCKNNNHFEIQLNVNIHCKILRSM